jgi:DNA-binding XRE family transcriptional regulator
MPQLKKAADIESLRDWYGLNQEDFGRALGVSKRAVIRWEKGEVEPSLPVVRNIGLLQEVRDRLEAKYHADAQQWLRRPHRALLSRSPLEVLTEAGPVPVRDLLIAREAGGYR